MIVLSFGGKCGSSGTEMFDTRECVTSFDSSKHFLTTVLY